MTRSHTSTRRRERARKTADVTADKTTDATPTATVAKDPAPVSGTTAVDQTQRSSAAVRGPSAPPRPATKLALIIAALRSEEGASIAGLAELTGWKTNSVRGVLAGTLKTRHGLVDANRVQRERHTGDGTGAALTGLIFDGDGRPMIPTFSYGRGGRCYRYYVASDLQLGKSLGRGRTDHGAPRRLPAKALEAAMLDHLRRLSGRPGDGWADLAPMLLRLEVRANDTQLLLDADALFSGDHPDLAFEDLQQRLELGERLVWEAGRAGVMRLALPGKLQFRGGRTWRTAGGRPSTVDPELIPALKWAHQILADAGCSPAENPAAWTEATSPASAYHRKLANLAFLSPTLQAAILSSKLSGITLQGLLARDIPLAWADQEQMLGLYNGLPDRAVSGKVAT